MSHSFLLQRCFSGIFLVTWLGLSGVFLAEGLAGQASTGSSPKQFRAGAATANVSPWIGLSINGGMQDRKVEYVHDELQARALVLDDGDTRLALVVVDSCMVPRSIFDPAKVLAERQTGIPADHILMSATHTHSAPAATAVFQSDPDPEYQKFLTRRLADAVVRAFHHLEPARIGWGAGQVPDQVFNRRWKMKPGRIPPNPFGGTDQVKMNPPAGSSDLIEPAGPTDPVVSVLSVRALDGRFISVLANYSLHYVGGTASGHASADYFGWFAHRIGRLLQAGDQDPPFVGILSNGTSGDINNIDFRRPRESRAPYQQMRWVADRVAEEAARVVQSLSYQDWVPLQARQTEIELAVRRPDPEALGKALRIVSQARGPHMQTLEEIYARETLFLSEYPERVSLLLQALRVGDLGIAAIPCEVFVEIGLELRGKSPFPQQFTISLANGYNGYLPTPEHHALGGYETWRARSSYLEVTASRKITGELLQLLKMLR